MEPIDEYMSTYNKRAAGKHFLLSFTGQQVYDILQFLQRRTVESKDFSAIKEAVHLYDLISDLAREQGFFGS